MPASTKPDSGVAGPCSSNNAHLIRIKHTIFINTCRLHDCQKKGRGHIAKNGRDVHVRKPVRNVTQSKAEWAMAHAVMLMHLNPDDVPAEVPEGHRRL